MIDLATYSYWVALGAVFLQLVTAWLFVEYFFLKEKYVSPYVSQFALWLVLLVGVGSAVGSHIYSEVFGLIPCALCWIQRGFLYSLVVLSIIALWRKYRGAHDTSIADYGIGLSVVGGIVALYGHYIQMGGSELVACPTAGIGADCAKRLVFEFGYVTFPLMSFTTFVFFIIVFCIYRKGNT